ncbi:MAG: TonB-dependent receptor [Candidatus Omnitrophota bacterium]
MFKNVICQHFPRIVIVSAIYSCYFLASAAADDFSSINSIVELKPIVISAVRNAVAGFGMAEDVFVVSAQRVKAMPAHDLSEVLARVPGVSMSVGGLMGQATSLSINGSNSRDVLVMVDDIPFNTQLSGQANPTRIPVENIERIEVIKGPSSSAWGSGLGGVVNVITKETGESLIPVGSVTSSFGAYATRKQSVDMAGKAGALGYYLMGSYMDTAGAHFQSPVREEKAFSKVSLPLGDQGKLTGSFGYSAADVRQHVFSTNRINETPYIARYGKLRLDVDKPDGNFNFSYKYNDQGLSSDTYNALTGARISASSNHNEYQGVGINGHVRMRGEDVLVMGVDVDRQVIKSSNYLTTAKRVNTQAPYANYTLRLDQWDLIPGLRFDNNNCFGNQLSPSLGSVFHFSKDNDTQWRLKASRAFTAPPLMWIYNDDPSVLVAPNLDLRAERANVYETGITVDLGRIRMDVNIYRSDVTDGLSTVYNSVLGAYQKQNIGKVRREGVEGQVDYRVSRALKFYVFGGYHDPVNRVTRRVVRGNGVALQSIGGGVNYMSARGWGVNLYMHYDRWDSLPLQANDRKPVFDLKLTRDWKSVYGRCDLGVFLNVYNLANSKYWTDPSLPLPERYLESGVTLRY